MRFKPKAPPSALARARTHQKKAEGLRDDDDAPLAHEYLERMRALEAAIDDMEAKAKAEYRGKLGKTDVERHEVLGYLLSKLPRARLDLLYKDPRIGTLNMLLHKRRLPKIIGDNHMLQDMGINWGKFQLAKKDLKFHLGSNTFRSSTAIALYLYVVRASVDKKVRKSENLVRDTEILELACGILRDVTTHIVAEMQLKVDTFLTVGERKQAAIARQNRPRRPLGRKV